MQDVYELQVPSHISCSAGGKTCTLPMLRPSTWGLCSGPPAAGNLRSALAMTASALTQIPSRTPQAMYLHTGQGESSWVKLMSPWRALMQMILPHPAAMMRCPCITWHGGGRLQAHLLVSHESARC